MKVSPISQHCSDVHRRCPGVCLLACRKWLPAAPPWMLACAWSTPLECPVRLKKLVNVPLEEPNQLRLLQQGRRQHERRRRPAMCMCVHVLERAQPAAAAAAEHMQ